MKRSAGSRHKYRELLEVQQKAKIYQQEYEELRPYLSAAKVFLFLFMTQSFCKGLTPKCLFRKKDQTFWLV
jgi:ABC-type amino acid transport system permease subunit